MPNITNHIEAHYSTDDIKALIIADMRGRGFPDIFNTDVQLPEDLDPGPRPAMPFGYVTPFTGYAIRKDITVKPKPIRD